MAYSLILVDDLGSEYPRKNLYLRDLAAAETRGDRAAAREIRAGRSRHPYIIKLAEFRAREKDFLKRRSLQQRQFQVKLKNMDRRERRLENDLFRARQNLEFYKPYQELSYDAELETRMAEVRLAREPGMLEHYRELRQRHRSAEIQLKSVENSEERAARQAADEEVRRHQEMMTANRLSLKQKAKAGVISERALRTGRKEDRERFRANRRGILYRTPRLAAREQMSSLRYSIVSGMEDQFKVLNAELSAVLRTTPAETGQQTIWRSLLSIPLPGLGQLLLGQYMKAFLFFLGAVFIYVIAVPYSLGFGNYQGDGIAGLISLAQGGARLERSLIFMIEGILAIVFLLVAAGIIAASFLDAKRTESDAIKGIRPRVWTETKANFDEKGFPYMVSVPVGIIVILIVAVPIITTLLLSFTNMNPDNQSKFTWVGLDNYKIIALGEGLIGSVFWRILGWTVVWTLGASSLQIATGFVLALLTNNGRLRGRKVFRTIFILPWAVPAFITIIFFSLMLSQNGVLTNAISGLAGRTVNVKFDTNLTRIALILIQGWCGSAYIFLLTTGSLQAIPGDLYEAAEIDGASSWQRVRAITIPMILFQTAPLLIGQYTFNFNNYTIIDIFNGGGPFEPSKYGNLAGSSDLLISYIFKLTITNQYQALGAAVAIIVSLVLIVVAFLGFRQTAAFKE